MQRGMAVAPGNHLCLHSSCSDILLDVRLVGVASNTKTTPPPSVPFSFPRVDTLCQTKSALGSMQEDPPPTPPTTTHPVFYIERHEVCRLNDVLYMERYFCSIQEAILTARKEAWSGSESEEEMVCADMNGLCIGGGGEGQLGRSDEGGVANCLVLDLTHGPSLFGIAAAMKGADFVQVGRSPPTYHSFQTCVAENNGVLDHIALSRLELSSLTPSHPVWDVVVSDVVGPQGTLRPGILDELAYLRSQFFHSSTEVLPSKMTVHAVCISSPTLKAQSCVLGTIPTLGFDIASFINRYQVSHFVDVDLSTLPHEKMSNTFELLTINLGTLRIKPLQAEAEICVTVETSGPITGIAYWFELALRDNRTISTGPAAYEGSHWHQAAFLLCEDLTVIRGNQLLVRGVVRDSCLDISLRATSRT